MAAKFAKDAKRSNSFIDWSSSKQVHHFDQYEDLNELTFPQVFVYGDALRDIGRKKDALRVIESLKEKDFEEYADQVAYRIPMYLGTVYKDMGDLPQAVSLFREALELNSRTTVTYIYLASALHECGEYQESLEVLDRALSIKGDTDEVYLNMALNLRSMKCYQEAYEAVQKALEIDPEYKSANILRDDLSEVVEMT